MKKGTLAVLCALCVVFIWLWVQCQKAPPAEAQEHDALNVTVLDTALRQVHGGDVAFSATVDDLIRSYNELYYQRNGTAFFSALNDWSCASLSRGIHSPYPVRRFYFCQDESIHSLPTVTVYTPLEERCIQELTINFDEHSFTDEGYQQYQELCLCAILAFFPELPADSAQALRDRILQLGNQHLSDVWFDQDALPWGMYCASGIGLYPYEAIGDWRRFCIIPVTPERLEDFREKGVMIYDLDGLAAVPSDDPSRLSGPCSIEGRHPWKAL